MRELSSIFVAWLVLYLLLFVRAVGRGEAAYDDFLDWAASPWLVALNVVAFAFLRPAHGHLVLAHAAGDGRAACAGAGCRRPAIIGAQYAGAGRGRPAFVFWLVTR